MPKAPPSAKKQASHKKSAQRPPKNTRSFYQWLWRIYVRTALIPILIVELLFIGGYFMANHLIEVENARLLRQEALRTARTLVRQEADLLNRELQQMQRLLGMLGEHFMQIWRYPLPESTLERSRYQATANGGYVTQQGYLGQSSALVSAYGRRGDYALNQAVHMAHLDPLMFRLYRDHPLIDRVYVYTQDSVIRQQPLAPLLPRYGEFFDIRQHPDFHYFSRSQPTREPQWRAVYQDMQTDRWMTSLILPLWLRSEPQDPIALLGVDVSINTLAQHLLNLHLPWEGYALLFDKDLRLLALPEAAHQDWQIAIPSTDTRNLLGYQPQRILGQARAVETQSQHGNALGLLKNQDSGLAQVYLNGHKLLVWEPIEATGWQLLVVLPEENLYQAAVALAGRFWDLSLMLSVVLLVFYGVLTLYVLGLVRRMAQHLTAPTRILEQAMAAIGRGEYTQDLPTFKISEFQSARNHLLHMSRMVQAGVAEVNISHARLQEAKHRLEEMNAHLEQRVARRTQELERMNTELQHEQAAQQKLITKLRGAYRQLVHAEKMASIGQLAAGVAHEINTPSSFVSSNLEVLQEYLALYEKLLSLYEQWRYADNEYQAHQLLAHLDHLQQVEDFDFVRADVQKLLSSSLEGIRRISKIVRSLKNYSRQVEETAYPLDMNEALDEALSMVWNELKYKVKVDKQYTDLPKILCIGDQIKQVFINLLMNAIQAIEKNGRLWIATGQHTEGEIWISIRDNGTGIKSEYLERIFDPFFTTKPVGSGTGLGLAISYGIIEQHGGQIHVHSEEGVGTEFIISLPLQPPVKQSLQTGQLDEEKAATLDALAHAYAPHPSLSRDQNPPS